MIVTTTTQIYLDIIMNQSNTIHISKPIFPKFPMNIIISATAQCHNGHFQNKVCMPFPPQCTLCIVCPIHFMVFDLIILTICTR